MKLYLIYFTLVLSLAAKEYKDSLDSIVSQLTPSEKIEYLGGICWEFRSKNIDLSIEAGLMALRIAKENDEFDRFAQICNFIGVVYNNKEDYISALHYYNKALETSIKIGNNLETAYAYNNIGGVFIRQGDNNTAIK